MTHIPIQVARNEQLLVMARDYLHFVSKFFEVINISATHIYHSALELSPLSSIIRKLYYSQRLTSSPRVVAGTSDSWDQSVTIAGKGHRYTSCTWSPCGRFIAAQTYKAMEIRDSHTLELLSTLAGSSDELLGGLAYSPDGHSLACLSATGLIIWDIQTGGIAKRTRNNHASSATLLWSSDGMTIAIMRFQRDQGQEPTYAVCMYDVSLGTMQFPSTVQSICKPYLWADDTSFWIMAAVDDDKAFTINIFKAGSALTKVESFPIQIQGGANIISFSPTTYHLSLSDGSHFAILDIQNSKYLLREQGNFCKSCFSPTGCLFTLCSFDTHDLRIWANNFGHYSCIGQFMCQVPGIGLPSLLFSPKSSSILGCSDGGLQVWHSDDGHTVLPTYSQPLTTISHNGTYIATADKGNNTVTIADPFSHTLSQIDVCTEIQELALVGNVLLVICSKTILAWHLTREGMVAGVSCDRRAGLSDSIWSIPVTSKKNPLSFAATGQTGIISYTCGLKSLQVYHIGTGEALQSHQEPVLFGCCFHSLEDVCKGLHHLHYHNLSRGDVFSVYGGYTGDQCFKPGLCMYGSCSTQSLCVEDGSSTHRLCVEDGSSTHRLYTNSGCSKDSWALAETIVQEGWVKDPEGRCRLWIPPEWRAFISGEWLCEITTLQFELPSKTRIVIMF